MLRVAVVGSGPGGAYSVGALTSHDGVLVDVIDRLPAPFGLVRYGVAPDHPKIRSISSTMSAMLEHPAVRFIGNVEVGEQLSIDDLRRHYDAVIFAVGAARDRRLGIPGEDLPGVFSARDFVAWYSGHPDAPVDRFTLGARTVAVIGAGNVALDVARILAKSVDELRPTDLPNHVLRVLESSQVEDIHVIARRGPAQAKFTTKELREMGELANADIVVDAADLELDELSKESLAGAPVPRRNLEVLQGWAARTPAGRPRRVHMHFNLRPAEVLGEDQVRGLRLERTRLDASGNATATGGLSTLEAQLVLRSIGYRGLPLEGVPFDADTGVIPSAGGRVLRDGIPVTGQYVAGWIKRGPTGVIGTNKRDANETVTALLADAPTLPRAPIRDPDALPALLAERGVRVVTWQGWCAIDKAEVVLGQAEGRARTKIFDLQALLRAAAGALPLPPTLQ